jgi:hypothetical protein
LSPSQPTFPPRTRESTRRHAATLHLPPEGGSSIHFGRSSRPRARVSERAASWGRAPFAVRRRRSERAVPHSRLASERGGPRKFDKEPGDDQSLRCLRKISMVGRSDCVGTKRNGGGSVSVGERGPEPPFANGRGTGYLPSSRAWESARRTALTPEPAALGSGRELNPSPWTGFAAGRARIAGAVDGRLRTNYRTNPAGSIPTRVRHLHKSPLTEPRKGIDRCSPGGHNSTDSAVAGRSRDSPRSTTTSIPRYLGTYVA